MAEQDDLVTRLFALWDQLPADDDGARTAFRELYTDPVRINGVDVPIEQLVRRARMMSAALAGRTTQMLSQMTTGDRTAVAFRMHGRHVGPMDTPLGPVDGNGQAVSMQIIDLLTVREGRISEIWMAADLLGMLAGSGAVRPATQDSPEVRADERAAERADERAEVRAEVRGDERPHERADERADEREVPASSSGA
jgi:SnoaL-like polyketide cyclase